MSRICAACSRPSNAARSNGVRFLSRERFRPRLRASVSSSSSLSRSRQLRTPFESPRTKHLLKTTKSNLPYGEQKANTIFRLMFAHIPGLASPGRVSYTCPKTQTSLLLEQSQPPQVFILPARVRDHSPERADRKCVAQAVVGHDDATAVGMAEDAMTSTHACRANPSASNARMNWRADRPRGVRVIR